ncbi:site-2 protease family protein [Haloferula sp.]|uniref:site-2 protease family protein n=1 Tax=Haloferula sp. TaxID=2497595 RepID=UPI003C7242A4
MSSHRHIPIASRLTFILLVSLPVVIIFLLPGGALVSSAWFWIALMFCFLLIWTIIGIPRDEEKDTAETRPRMLHEDQQPESVKAVMDIHVATDHDGIQAFQGPLKLPASAAFESLSRTLEAGSIPLIQQDEKHGEAIIILPAGAREADIANPSRPVIHWLLFALTILTTTWAGAAHQGINPLNEPERLIAGLPYSLGLLAILGVHEMGHYFAARRHGIDVTPPFFIPVPFALGTFGAFIKMRTPSQNRTALFDVAVAGPLAGLAIAIPALLVGLRTSTILPPDTDSLGHMFGGTSAGSSLLFALLAKLSFGDALQSGHLVRLSPLAFAGWLGLLITALNLLPIGQLDGGHMARAMFGTRTGMNVSRVAMWTLFMLAIFIWPGLMMWAFIVFFIAGRGAPPLNDVTPIPDGRRWLGYATFAILAAIVIPLPHALWNAAGFHCPYL